MKSLSAISPEARLRQFVLFMTLAGGAIGSVRAGEDLQTQFLQERTSLMAETKLLREQGPVGEMRLWTTQNEKRLRARIERGRALAAQLSQEKPRAIRVIDIPGDASPDLEKVLMMRAMRRNEWRLLQYEIRNLSPDAASAATAEWLRRQEPQLVELRALQRAILEESGQNTVLRRNVAPPESASPAVKAFSKARDAFSAESQKASTTAVAGDPARATPSQPSQFKTLEERLKILAEQAARESVIAP